MNQTSYFRLYTLDSELDTSNSRLQTPGYTVWSLKSRVWSLESGICRFWTFPGIFHLGRGKQKYIYSHFVDKGSPIIRSTASHNFLRKQVSKTLPHLRKLWKHWSHLIHSWIFHSKTIGKNASISINLATNQTAYRQRVAGIVVFRKSAEQTSPHFAVTLAEERKLCLTSQELSVTVTSIITFLYRLSQNKTQETWV